MSVNEGGAASARIAAMPPSPLDGSLEQGLSVGTAAARLGVAPGTLRSWGRRYGLVPAERSGGGHRRYTEADMSRLIQMQRFVSEGLTPANAARLVMGERAVPSQNGGTADPPGPVPAFGRTVRRPSDSGDPTVAIDGRRGPLSPPFGVTDPPTIGLAGADKTLPAPASPPSQKATTRGRRPGGPGGRVLAVPGASAQARGLARAASRLDSDAVSSILGDLLAERGAIDTWDDVLRPVLVAAGLWWARTGQGIDVEHLLSEATIEALRAHRAVQLRPAPGRPVLMACSPEDQHVIPLHILWAALAERRVPGLMIGARVPESALVSAIRRTRASAVFVWRQLVTGNSFDEVPRLRPPVLVVVGGPGWATVELPRAVHRARTISAAVALLAAAPR